MKDIIFFDTEIDSGSGKVLDIGAVRSDGQKLHSAKQTDFTAFIRNCPFLCGHNILSHDLKYIGQLLREAGNQFIAIDTLRLSPLLFPKRPYHKLLKDDKLQTDELNNPLNDSIKARDLFYDEVNAFSVLPSALRVIYCGLLGSTPEFSGFFRYLDLKPVDDVEPLIRREFHGRICGTRI